MVREPDSPYSTVLLDHYENPRNVGELPEADAFALVHNPVCGDLLRLAVRVSDGRIVEARFKAYGCAPAIAASSVVTELLTDATLDEAAEITEEIVADALGGLPPMKAHAAALAREGVRQVLGRLGSGQGS